LLLCLSCVAQNASTGNASSTVPCSVSNTGNDNKIRITCGVGKQQGEKILNILNKIVANQLDPDRVMAKLDEILNTRNVTSISAPSGIAIGGGTVTNPTVNNFAPAPAKFTFTEEVVTPLPADGSGPKVMHIHVRTDRSVPGAIVGISLSGPVENPLPGKDDPTLSNSGVIQTNWGMTNGMSFNGTPIQYGLFVSINMPSVFLPGQDLIVTVRSKTDVHVLLAAPVSMGPAS
jgi:hypothetical protein